MAADGVPAGDYLLQDAGLPHGVLADREEDRLGAMRREGCKHRRRMARPGAIVECQYHLARLQEVVALEVLEAEAGAAQGVDLDHA